MRAAGVPARVVVGYQGGDFNSYGKYLLVRQSHAARLNEVWLAGANGLDARRSNRRGRAGRRVRRGQLTRELAGQDVPGRLVCGLPRGCGLRAAWDATRTAWYNGIVGFDPARQARLLNALGMSDAGWQGMAIALGVGFALSALALGAWLAWEIRPRRREAVQAAWLGLCVRLAGAGVARRAAEGPVVFGRRAAARLPALAAPLSRVVECYVQVRYLPGSTDGERKRFIGLARQFTERL